MGKSAVDAQAGTDFKALQEKYADLQKNAYTATGSHGKGQSVTVEEMNDLKAATDDYVNKHVTDPTQKASALKEFDAVINHMLEDVTNQQSTGQTDNSGWDEATTSMASMLTDVAADGADEVWTPDSISSSDGTGGSTGTEDFALPNGSSNSTSGNGWDGDLNKATTSAQYKGKSLDQLLADKSSIVAQEVGNQPDVVAAIRKMSSKYNIPDGLIAAVVIQESNGNRKDRSYNSGYEGTAPHDQCYDVGVVQSPLWDFPGSTTAEKEKNAQDPEQCIERFAKELSGDYKKSGSWGVALRNWNSGGNANPNDLSSKTGGYGVENYVKNILGHIAMGSNDYGS